MTPRYNRRTDDNHKEIAEALADVPGVKTKHTAHFGSGFPDLMARHENGDTLYLFEIKTPGETRLAGLSRAELEFMFFLFGIKYIRYTLIDNAEDALRVMGLLDG